MQIRDYIQLNTVFIHFSKDYTTEHMIKYHVTKMRKLCIYLFYIRA